MDRDLKILLHSPLAIANPVKIIDALEGAINILGREQEKALEKKNHYEERGDKEAQKFYELKNKFYRGALSAIEKNIKLSLMRTL